ncbi:MAG: hypothetical protein ACOC0F_00885 [archaeon]
MRTDDNEFQKTVRRLHDHLAASQERPVERTASRWIGEAEAVAADLVGGSVERDVLRERLSHVEELLGHVDDTDDSAANDHVAEAERITASLLDRLDAE